MLLWVQQHHTQMHASHAAGFSPSGALPQIDNLGSHAGVGEQEAHAAAAGELVIHQQVAGGDVLDHQAGTCASNAPHTKDNWQAGCGHVREHQGAQCCGAAQRSLLSICHSTRHSAAQQTFLGVVDLAQLGQERGHLACGVARFRGCCGGVLVTQGGEHALIELQVSARQAPPLQVPHPK